MFMVGILYLIVYNSLIVKSSYFGNISFNANDGLSKILEKVQ